MSKNVQLVQIPLNPSIHKEFKSLLKNRGRGETVKLILSIECDRFMQRFVNHNTKK